MDIKKFAIGIMILLFSFNMASAGTLLVTQVKSNSVILIDEDTLKVIKELPVGYKPYEVCKAMIGRLINKFKGKLSTIRY